ncbi:MAG: Hsp20/alpha crystallin family protein [Deltaproteobacteria bacterium]|jgi:HSP20 family protein
MAIVRWDPFRDAAALQDRINRIFNESFGPSRDLDDEVILSDWRPPVDIYETTDGIVLKVELPGINKEDVSVEVKDNVLTLKGERLLDPKIKDEQYYRKERSFGKFNRSFSLQETIKPDLIKASLKNGVLTVEIPRPEEEKAKQVTVDID